VSVSLYTAPALEPVTLQEAKDHLRIEHSEDDAQITGHILAARQYVEEICWRGLVTQVWDLTLPSFPKDHCKPSEFEGIELPKGNLIATSPVAFVKYLDAAGTLQTMPTSDYLVDSKSVPGRIRRAYGVSWPTHRLQWDAVRVQYQVGWANAAAVPMPLVQAMLLLISQMYEHRTPRSPASSPRCASPTTR
jgi:uncharacterized phiE125 gp8 family phage protein